MMHDLVHIRDDIGTYKSKFANKAKQPDIITLLYYNLHVHIKVKVSVYKYIFDVYLVT